MIDNVISFEDDVVRPVNFFAGSGISFAELAVVRGGEELAEEIINTSFTTTGTTETITSADPPLGRFSAFDSFDTDLNGDDLPNCHIVYKCQTRTDTGIGSRTNFGNTDDSNPNNDEDRVGNSEFTLIRKTTLEYDPTIDSFGREDEVVADTVIQSNPLVSAPTIVNNQDLFTTTATHTNFTRSGTTFFDNGSVSSIVSGSEAIELSNPLVTSDWLRDRPATTRNGGGDISSRHVNDADDTNLEASYSRQSGSRELMGSFTRFSTPPDEDFGGFERGDLNGVMAVVEDQDFSLATFNQLGVESDTGGETAESETEIGDIEFPYVGRSGSYSSPESVISGEPWRVLGLVRGRFDRRTASGDGGSGFDLKIDNLRSDKIRINYNVTSFDPGLPASFSNRQDEVEPMSRGLFNIPGGANSTTLVFGNVERLVVTEEGEEWVVITDEAEIIGCINVSYKDLTYQIAGDLNSKKATVETTTTFTRSITYGCGTDRDLSYTDRERSTGWTNFGHRNRDFKVLREVTVSGYNGGGGTSSFNGGASIGRSGPLEIPDGVPVYSDRGSSFSLASSSEAGMSNTNRFIGATFLYKGMRLGRDAATRNAEVSNAG